LSYTGSDHQNEWFARAHMTLRASIYKTVEAMLFYFYTYVKWRLFARVCQSG